MDAPFEMKELDVTLVAGGTPLRVIDLRIEEGMSEVMKVTALVASPTDIDFEPLLDEAATLSIDNARIPIRNFSLKLASAKFAGFVDQTIRYTLELRPEFFFASFRKNTRKFRDMTTEAIIDKVLGEDGVAHAWNNTRACESRPYTVQYRETDRDFVERLLEYEGIYFTFDDDGTIELGDASGSLPEVPGEFELAEFGEGGTHARPNVTSIGKTATFGSGAATVNDYNWKTPSTSLLSTSKSQHDPQFETYDYPVGYRDPGVGKILSKLRMEAHAAPKRGVDGTSSVVGFRAGSIFLFSHSEAIDFSDRYLLVHVEHHFVTRWAKDGVPKYENSFKAIGADTPFRPKLVTPRPTIVGNHTVMVRGPAGEEIHTDQHGRAKVQFHWDREANGLDDSRWIRTLQETSSSIVISRVGWEVSAGYVDGDPDRPMGLGRQINGQMVPTYGQPSHKNRMTLKSETYPGKQGFNELRMDDSAGKMFMDWHAQKDFSNTVGNDKTETIGNNYTHLITDEHMRTVEQNQSVEIGSNETRQVGLDYKERVVKDRNETIGGSETIKVKRNHTLSVGGNDTEDVGSLRMTFVGSISVEDPPEPELMQSLVPSSAKGFSDAAGDQAVDKTMGPSTAGEYTGGVGSRGFPAGSSPGAAPGVDQGGPPDPGAAMENVVPSQEDALSPGDGATDAASNFKGMIQRSVEKMHVKQIGGAYMKLAGQQIANNVGKVICEVVGGVKLTTSIDENVTQAMAGRFFRTVGGNIVRKAKGRVTHSSKTSDIQIGASMDLTSMEKVEVRGKEIDLVAETKFSLATGGLLIELTPDTIKITGDTKLSSAGKILFKAAPDKLTA